jgi:uncharacterized cupredoxin-like copper-binding protein
MSNISRIALVVAASSAFGFLASPSFASTTIKVVESGEGGGAMSIALDPPTAKAGPVTFQVHNDAISEEHEMVVVKLKSPDQKVPFNARKDRVDERKLKSMGEVSDLKPSANGSLNVNLKAGTYLLLCNIKGHYSAGMHAQLVVLP